MLKLFFLVLQISIVLLLAIFILNNSFIVSFEINDFIYSISSSYVFVFIILILITIFLIQGIYFKSKFKFFKYRNNQIMIKKTKGYNAFVNGMISLANKDFKQALIESKKISNYLKDNPSLSLLLKSEVYKVEKKYEDLNIVYEEMIKNKNTENLAFRGLMEQYLRSQDFHHAFIYGEKLFNKNPYIEKIYETLVNIVAKTNNWQQLLIISDRAYSKKIIDKKTFEENKSIAFYEIAKIKQHSDYVDAKKNIEKALSLRKYFPPYVKIYINLLIEQKKYNNAKKYIKKAWNENPHSEYKGLIIHLATSLGVDCVDLTKFIISSNHSAEESKILLIEASIESKKWEIARNEIKDLLDTRPKKIVCMLMAKIEEGETGDTSKINSWNLRAKNGAEQKLWVCLISKKYQEDWTSISESGYFNSLEWKQPYMLNQDFKINNSLFYEN